MAEQMELAFEDPFTGKKKSCMSQIIKRCKALL